MESEDRLKNIPVVYNINYELHKCHPHQDGDCACGICGNFLPNEQSVPFEEWVNNKPCDSE